LYVLETSAVIRLILQNMMVLKAETCGSEDHR